MVHLFHGILYRYEKKEAELSALINNELQNTLVSTVQKVKYIPA